MKPSAGSTRSTAPISLSQAASGDYPLNPRRQPACQLPSPSLQPRSGDTVSISRATADYNQSMRYRLRTLLIVLAAGAAGYCWRCTGASTIWATE